MPPRNGTQWRWRLEEWTSLNLTATETTLVQSGSTSNGQNVKNGWSQMAAIHNAMWRSVPGDQQVRAGKELSDFFSGKWHIQKSSKWRFNVLRTSGNWSAAEMAARSSLRLAIEAWATHLGVGLGPNPFQGNDAVGGNINPSPPAGANAAARAQWNNGQGQVDASVPALGTHVPASPPGWPVGVVWPPVLGVALPAGFGAPAAPPVVPAGPAAILKPAAQPTNTAMAQQPARVQTAGEYLAAKRKRDSEEEEEEETEEEKRRRDRERQERIKRIQRENAELTRRCPDRPLF